MGMLEREYISHFETEHGAHEHGQQNPEGESILSFAQAYNLVVANAYFQKKDEHLIIYKSGTGVQCITTSVVSIPVWITSKSAMLKDRDLEEIFNKSAESKNNHLQIRHVKI